MSITLTFPVGYKPVFKHGEHDQSSHGSWATGNFDEDTDGADAQDSYFSRYGIKTDGTKEIVGVSRDEVSAIDFYTGDGYSNINSFFRQGQDKLDMKGDVLFDRLTQISGDLDKLIDEAPEIFGDKNLFRVYSENVMNGIKEGDVVTDKGYLSTTRIDITNPRNRDDLENLQLIQESKDVPAIILPSPSGKGKGLAVDYIKNSVQDSPLVTNVATANREKEVLLPRSTPLKFMGYKKVNDLEVAVFQRMDK
jgi:hypothetical protein